MNFSWLTNLKKGALAVLTFGAAYIAANPSIVTSHIPANIGNLTVGSAIAAIIVMAANWLKNKDVGVVPPKV